MKWLLSAIGIKDVFDEQSSNLSGLAKEQLFVNQIYHQSYVKVNEEGNEVAAATGDVTNTYKSKSPTFSVDHPFMYMIVENDFGTILFEGIIVDPSNGTRGK